MKIMLVCVLEWKVTHPDAQGITPEVAHEFIEEAVQGDMDEMEEGPEQSRIERLVDRRDKRRTSAVRAISENHTRQEGKARAH